MKQNVFYKTNNLYKRLNEFVEDAKRLSYESKIEQKYVEGRWREDSDKSLEFIINGVKEPEDIKFIKRFKIFDFQKDALEAVFIYTPKEWYLAWFYIDPKHEDFFVKKYKLKCKTWK